MGNETSRPEMPLGRARSLSPLPGIPSDDDDDNLRPFPSTAPAYSDAVYKDISRPRPGPSSPGPPPESRSPSPRDGRLTASQPPPPRLRSVSLELSPPPASQPKLSNGKKSRSKRQSLAAKSKTKKKENSASSGAPAGGDATPAESSQSKKKGKRPSVAATTDDEPAAAIHLGDLAPTSNPSPEQAMPSSTTKSKEKGKGTLRRAPIDDLFDSFDGPPPSAQPIAKRSRRNSDATPRKKRKTPEPSDDPSTILPSIRPEQVYGKTRNGGSTPTVRSRNVSSRASPVDNIKVEQEEEDMPLDITPARRSRGEASPRDGAASSTASEASPTSSQHSQGDSAHVGLNGQAGQEPSVENEPRMDLDNPSDLDVPTDQVRMEPVVKGEPGMELGAPNGESRPEPAVQDESDMDLDIPDVLPDHQDNFNPEASDIEMQREDDPVSAAPEPQDLPVKTDDAADAVPAQDGSASEPDTTMTGTTVHNGSGGESSEHTGQLSTPTGGDAQTVPTPLASSPAIRHTSKRKMKTPFSPRENEENANAFAELPLDDVAAQPRLKRLQVSSSAVQAEAGPSKATNESKQKKSKKPKPKKPAVPDTISDDDNDSDHEESVKKYRSGALTKTEQNKIIRVVERFREDEDMTQEAVNEIIHANPQTSTQAIHRQLWALVQDACPSRPRQKLINWCRQRFHNFAGRGVWTPEQDDELARLVEVHGKKWSLISGLINRHQKDARDRWRNYIICREKVKSDTWSDDEEDRFRDLVEAAIEKIQEGPNKNTSKPPEDLINWLKISEAMGHTRSRLQCLEKWKRLRAAEPVPAIVPTLLPEGNSWRLQKARKDIKKMTVQDKYDLMRAIRDSGVGTDAKINWKQIGTRVFHGKYERQALVVVWGRLRTSVPRWQWSTARICARYLCDMYEREGNFGPAGAANAEQPEGDAQDEAPVSSADPKGKGKAALRQPLAETAASEAGGDVPDEDPVSSADPRGKGKEVLRQPLAETSASESESRASKPEETAAPDAAAKDSNFDPGESSSKPRTTTKPSKSTSKPGKTTSKSNKAISKLSKAARPDVAPEHRASARVRSKKRPEQDERERSPEFGTDSPQPSPSVEAQATRKRIREKRESTELVEEEPSGSGEGNEKEIPPPTPNGAKGKGLKRTRRESVSNDNTESHEPKKRKAGPSSSAPVPERAWSVISSDMDDMEDIPARLTQPSQAAE